MRLVRSFVVAVVAVALAIGPVGASEFIDEQYMASKPPVANVPGWVAGYYDDGVADVRGGSALFAYTNTANGQRGWSAASLCDAVNDPKCAGFDVLEWRAYLPECSVSVTTNCIAGVEAIIGDKVASGVFSRQFPDVGVNDFVGNGGSIPSGESPSLWSFPGVTHAGGSEFLAVVSSAGAKRGNAMQSNLRMSLYPVRVLPKAGAAPQETFISKQADGTFGLGTWDEREFLFRGSGEVAQRWPFPADVRFRMKVRLANGLTGWLHGRVADPEIQIANQGSGQEITVTASPTIVPVLDVWSPFAALPADLQADLRAYGPSGAYYYGKAQDGFENITLTMSNGVGGSQQDLDLFLKWVQVAKDKAAAAKSAWTMRTMSANELQGAEVCLQDARQLAGIVSTNSTVYLAGPPTYNRETGTLDYRVAAPHWDRAGGVNIGRYSLIMRADVARCLYGFSKAPISAAVQVVSADGQQQVATTNVKETNGWLYLTAAGYTYSSPTVKVKLAQKAPTVPKSVAEKKTIACVKGKTVKKVTAVAPKCPAGFKLKK